MKKIMQSLLLVMLGMILMTGIAEAATAKDAQINGAIGSNATKTYSADDNITAYSGNITHFDINVELSTLYWVGFFGNVTKTTTLTGGTNDFYSWGSADATTGTVLLSNSTNVDWASIGAGAASHAQAEDAALGIGAVPDNVTSTLSSTYTGSFTISGTTISSADNAVSVNTTSNGGTAWQTVLLNDANTNAAVYANPIIDNNPNYAGVASDFQLMVPVGGTSRVYYMYAALD